MASLPPYSTYRTDAKQMMFPQATSHGNILSFVPPGFKQELNVKFPDSRLAVCEKCKKNFKTRDMCRVRNTHTTAPWTTAYICITIDDSCLDEDGNYIDKPLTVRMVQWQPYCVKIPFGPKTPVCAACKRTNRTRSFCRERHKHRHLPWCTVYVLLSSLEAADPSTVVAGPSTPVEEGETSTKTETKKKKGKDKNNEEEEEEEEDDEASKKDDRSTTADTISSENGGDGDDINDIPDSRTFLAKVSCRNTSIHWLELSEFDSAEVASFPGADPQQYAPGMMEPHAAHAAAAAYHHYGAGGMGYAAQQHQNALKSRQQYFFHMQQQHQQHYAAAAAAASPSPWPPQPYETMGATAGEAAAAQQQQRRGQEEMAAAAAAAAQQQQWAMYYPPHGHYPPPEGHPMHGNEAGPGEHYATNTPPESEAEEPELKRQRV